MIQYLSNSSNSITNSKYLFHAQQIHNKYSFSIFDLHQDMKDMKSVLLLFQIHSLSIFDSKPQKPLLKEEQYL